MKSKLLLLLTFCLLFTSMSYSTTLIISASGMSFSPNTGTINLGDTVIFQWVEGVHTTTSTSVPVGAATWDEQLNATSPSYMYLPTVAGDYAYKCIPHEQMGMTGTFTVNPPTGIAQPDLQLSVKLYPNPAQSELYIEFPQKTEGNYMITDITGKELQTGRIPQSERLGIDLSGWTNGLYFFRISTSAGDMSVKKFSIIR